MTWKHACCVTAAVALGCNPAGSRLTEGIAAFDAGDADAAESSFSEVVKEWPESTEAPLATDYLGCIAARRAGDLQAWELYSRQVPATVCKDEAVREVERLTAEKAEEARKAAVTDFRIAMAERADACEQVKKGVIDIAAPYGVDGRKMWLSPLDYSSSHYALAVEVGKMIVSFERTFFPWRINLGEDKLNFGPECAGALKAAVERLEKNCLKDAEPTDTEWIRDTATAECGA